MRRVRFMIGGLLMGALLGALAVWTRPGATGRPAGDPLIAGTRQVCEAILTDDAAKWVSVRQRYFSSEGEGARLLKVAKAQSLYFDKASHIESLRRSADGTAGERRLVAVACRARTASGGYDLTLHWERERGGPWRPTDLSCAPTAEPESPGNQSLPVSAKTPGEENSKRDPQAH